MVQLEDSGDSQELIRSATHQLMFTDTSIFFFLRGLTLMSYMPDSFCKHILLSTNREVFRNTSLLTPIRYAQC